MDCEQEEFNTRFHMFALDLDNHKFLIKRRSGSHLDMESKQYLYHIFAVYLSHHKTICEMFKLSKSSHYRIVGNEDKELKKIWAIN